MRHLCILLVLFIAGAESWRPRRMPISLLRDRTTDARLPLPEGYSYKQLQFEQQIDHFGFVNNGTYKQRYLLADQFWNRNGGPIFFYTGNEGDIEWFCNNTGFMWDIAEDFRALLVFAEHRYYGKSLPYGAETYKKLENLNYLTSEQALADFAALIENLKSTIPGASKSPVIAFGGSYGGMLAAWFRIKYPNIVTGSLAASAPIWQFKDLTPCTAFLDTVTNTFKDSSPTCVANIRQAFKTLDTSAAQDCSKFLDIVTKDFNDTDPQCQQNLDEGWYTLSATGSGAAGGYQLISQIFKVCTPLTSKYDLAPFLDFLAGTYTNLAMVDYPYPANFLADLPAWPVKVACSFLSKPLQGNALLEALAQVTNLYYNYTGQSKCLNWTADSTGSLGYAGWDYQSCTEMVMPMCSNGSNMFYNIPWDFQGYSDECYRKYKVRPREDWVSLEYWAKQLKATSNIIFSNGLYDPWSSGGVMQSISDTIVAIQIPHGAHHLDLRARNPQDTRAVINAREQENNIIRGWLGLTPV